MAKTMEERREERTERHVSSIREMLGNSPGEKVNLSTLRNRADQKETEYGDETLHDALDEVEREVIHHNRDIHRESAGGPAGTPRTMKEAQERAQETRQRTQEHFEQAKAAELEEKRGLAPVLPTSANHPSKAGTGKPLGRFRNKRARR